MRKKFLLRIDQELWTDISRWAQDELRSINGQIEYILRQAVRKRAGQPEPEDQTTTKPDAETESSETRDSP